MLASDFLVRKASARDCAFHRKDTLTVVGVRILLEGGQRYSRRENTPVFKIIKDIQNAQTVHTATYYCFINKSQTGALFDLYDRQRFFFMKDCKLLPFNQGF